MSRRRKHETEAHRRERNRRRLRSAEKRIALSDWHMKRAIWLYLNRGSGRRLIWWHVPRSWARKIRTRRLR